MEGDAEAGEIYPEELETLLLHSSFDALPEACERLEPKHTRSSQSTHWPWALHLLSLVRSGHLQAARFAHQRSPSSIRSHAELASAWLLVRHLYSRHFAAALQTLSQAPWSDTLRPLAHDTRACIFRAAESAIASAYRTISAHTAASFLNMSAEDATLHLRSLGWTVHASGDMLDAPGKPSSPVSASSDFNVLSSAAVRSSIGASKAAMHPSAFCARNGPHN